MVMSLLFTAVVTPVEVAFLDEGEYITPLFFINRVVDLAFILDMIISFNLAFQQPPSKGGAWVYNRVSIVRHYVFGWFVIDLFSVLPFFLMSLNYSDPWGNSVAIDSSEVIGPGNMWRSAVLLRVARLLRMLKLMRIFKASRVIERNLLDVALHRWEMTYSMLKILKLICLLCVFAHFQACVWGLFSAWMDPPNWIAAFDADYIARGENGDEPPHPLDRYAAALYWSVMTLTSIGYGEMTPLNTVERWLCSVYMLFSGVVWTYVIGSVAAIATTLNPNQIAHENTMDQLNYFMRERQLPRGMRMTLRDFFMASRRVNQLNSDGELLDKMSPLLQGSVALAANKQWIDQIWFLRDIGATRAGIEFIASVAKRLVIRNFVAKERLPVGQLYILRKGMCVKMWRFLGTRRVWGEDMILDVAELIDHAQAVALTYVEVYTLRRHALDALLDEHPIARRAVKRAARRITLQRALLKFLATTTGKRGPCSFIPRSMSLGADVVEEKLTVEDKVDASLSQLGVIAEGLALQSLLGGAADGQAGASTEVEGGAGAGVATSTADHVNSAMVGEEPAGRGLSVGSMRPITNLQRDVTSMKQEMAELKTMMAQVLGHLGKQHQQAQDVVSEM